MPYVANLEFTSYISLLAFFPYVNQVCMQKENENARLEAFSDGVFAIAITLLIIDIKIPSVEQIYNKQQLWLTLKHLLPSIFAFLLSFITILITWVNHHEALKFVEKSSPPFVYANGLLLLTVVFVPFPTSMLGEFVFTDRASPAVMLYSSVFALQAFGWTLMCTTALRSSRPLINTSIGKRYARQNLNRSYYAIALYSICAVLAYWFPMVIATLVALTWIIWLIVGINLKND